MTTPTGFVPRTPVPPPVVTPRRYTLLGAIPEVPGDGEGRWERGVEYYSLNCNLTTSYIDGWCPPIGDDGDVDDWDKPIDRFDPFPVRGAPFTVVSGVDCTSPVFPSQDEAEAALKRGEDVQVETRFWAQQMQRPDTAVVRPGDVLGLDDAIGYLEEEAAVRYAGQLFIHVPVRALVHLDRLRIVAPDRNVLRTRYGSIVIPAAGYRAGLGPEGAPPPDGGWWLLATGQPVYRRSEVFSHEAFDVKTNRRGAVAERTYVITADCAALAVQAAPCSACPQSDPAPISPSGQTAVAKE